MHENQTNWKKENHKNLRLFFRLGIKNWNVNYEKHSIYMWNSDALVSFVVSTKLWRYEHRPVFPITLRTRPKWIFRVKAEVELSVERRERIKTYVRDCIRIESADDNVNYHLVVSANEVTARDGGGIRLNNDYYKNNIPSMETFICAHCSDIGCRLLGIYSYNSMWENSSAIFLILFGCHQRKGTNLRPKPTIRLKRQTNKRFSQSEDQQFTRFTRKFHELAMHLASFSFILMFQLNDCSIDRLQCIRSACLQFASVLTSFVNIERLKLTEGPSKTCSNVHGELRLLFIIVFNF